MNGMIFLSPSLDSGREQAIASEKGRLLSEKNISLNGYTGREMVVELSEGILKTRMYVTRQRLYQIIVVMPKPRASTGEKIRFEESIADKFLDSFKLTMNADKQYFELWELLQGQRGDQSTELLFLPGAASNKFNHNQNAKRSVAGMKKKQIYRALALTRMSSLALAIFADVVITVIVILNSLRLLRFDSSGS
ncbi:MAG: hypothetical protein AB1631_02825 [Acidobacteriota bacterium]